MVKLSGFCLGKVDIFEVRVRFKIVLVCEKAVEFFLDREISVELHVFYLLRKAQVPIYVIILTVVSPLATYFWKILKFIFIVQ